MKTKTAPAMKGTGHYRHLFSNPHRLKSLDPIAVIMPFRRSQEICSQSDPADSWYCVVSGAARKYVLRADGRRQIIGLLLPGDFFGLTAGAEYDFTVEAVGEGTVVAAYPRRRVEMLADSDPAIAREIREIAFEALSRLQAQLMISRPHHRTGESRRLHPRDGGAAVARARQQRAAAGLPLRYCRLPGGVGRDGEPVADRPETSRCDPALGHPDRQDRRPRRSGGR